MQINPEEHTLEAALAELSILLASGDTIEDPVAWSKRLQDASWLITRSRQIHSEMTDHHTSVR